MLQIRLAVIGSLTAICLISATVPKNEEAIAFSNLTSDGSIASTDKQRAYSISEPGDVFPGLHSLDVQDKENQDNAGEIDLGLPADFLHWTEIPTLDSLSLVRTATARERAQ